MVSDITVNADSCIKCGICVKTCPVGIYVQENGDHVPDTVDINFCVSCGHCVAIFPLV
jgi:ferredoxin